MTLEVVFVGTDCAEYSKEYIDDVTGYTISGENSTLTVNIENSNPIVFNYEYVLSVRYVEPVNKSDNKEDESDYDWEYRIKIDKDTIKKWLGDITEEFF